MSAPEGLSTGTGMFIGLMVFFIVIITWDRIPWQPIKCRLGLHPRDDVEKFMHPIGHVYICPSCNRLVVRLNDARHR